LNIRQHVIINTCLFLSTRSCLSFLCTRSCLFSFYLHNQKLHVYF